MLKKYFVVVDHPDYKEDVHNGLQAADGTDTIPDRSVECLESFPHSNYNGVFLLTDEEAEKLKADPKVRDVHLSPEEQGFVLQKHGTRPGSYDKSFNSISSSHRNWGLARCISATENFGTSNTLTNFTYNLTGKGVDVIIMDTGVEPWHPEFAVNSDGTGGTRCVDIDWTSYGAITSVPTGGFMGDCDGHGTNIATIIAGNTCGWAPDAKIYSFRIISNGTAGPYNSISDNRTLTLVNELNAWQTVRLFHQNKSVDPTTGYKRPTVVNASYGYTTDYSRMTSVTYRGVTRSTTTTTGNTSLLYGTLGYYDCPGDGTCPVRVSAVDAEIANCIAAGVIITGSAGNDSHKIDKPTGSDYNNYWTSSLYGNIYYHRGSTPSAATDVICVGAISYSLPEHKASFSATGPRIDVFAPGYIIAGGWNSGSNGGGLNAVVDPRSSISTSSGASYYINKITGTSQASPQVAGICALYAELRPWSTPQQVRTWITATSAKNLLSESFYGTFVNTGTYTNWAGLQAAGNNYLFMPFSLPNPLTIA